MTQDHTSPIQPPQQPIQTQPPQTPSATPPVPPTSPTPSPPSPLTPKKSNKLVLVGITALFIILAGGTAIFFYFQNNKPKETTTTQPQPTSTPTQLPKPTANWKTYTNTKHGFSFKYPTGFEPSDQIQNIEQVSPIYLWNQSNTTPIGQAIVVFIEENSNKLTFEDWLNDKSRMNKETILQPEDKLVIQEEIISGIKWLNFTKSPIPPGFPPSGNIYWITEKDGNFILIGLLNLNLNIHEQSINQILSTFTFLSATKQVPSTQPILDSTLNWKTHINNKQNFSLDYPELEHGSKIIDNVTLVQFYKIAPNGLDTPEFPYLQISIIENQSNLTGEQWIMNESSDKALFNITENLEWNTFNNWFVSSRGIATFGPETYAFGFFNKRVVKITTTQKDEVLTQILSTFKFLD